MERGYRNALIKAWFVGVLAYLFSNLDSVCDDLELQIKLFHVCCVVWVPTECLLIAKVQCGDGLELATKEEFRWRKIGEFSARGGIQTKANWAEEIRPVVNRVWIHAEDCSNCLVWTFQTSLTFGIMKIWPEVSNWVSLKKWFCDVSSECTTIIWMTVLWKPVLTEQLKKPVDKGLSILTLNWECPQKTTEITLNRENVTMVGLQNVWQGSNVINGNALHWLWCLIQWFGWHLGVNRNVFSELAVVTSFYIFLTVTIQAVP